MTLTQQARYQKYHGAIRAMELDRAGHISWRNWEKMFKDKALAHDKYRRDRCPKATLDRISNYHVH